MNPVLLLIIILFFGNLSKPGPAKSRIRMPVPAISLPGYIDTFKIELILDHLHNMTEALEKINHLNQSKNVPTQEAGSPFSHVDRIQDSLGAVRPFLNNGKSASNIDSLNGLLSNVKKFGDMEQMFSTFSPFLSMMTNQDNK